MLDAQNKVQHLHTLRNDTTLVHYERYGFDTSYRNEIDVCPEILEIIVLRYICRDETCLESRSWPFSDPSQ